MKIEGYIEKEGKFWIVNFPDLDRSTQGMTKKEAYYMAGDYISCLSPIENIEVNVEIKGKNKFLVGSNNTKAMISILLMCKREQSGLSLAQVAGRLGEKSRNAYYKYEQGKVLPSIEKLERLLEAVDSSLVMAFS